MEEARIVLVTGSNRGIGLEFVRQFLDAGDHVFAGCRKPDAAGDLQALRESHPDHLTICRLDVTDVPSIRETAATITDRVGRLDVLVNNAGVGADGEHGLPHVDEAQMLRVLHVNAVGPVSVTRECADLLRRGRSPRVINLTSGAGRLDFIQANPGTQYSYGASKAALHFNVRKMAFDLQADGIVMAGMGPGYVLTDMTRGPDRDPPLRPPESVRGMIATMDRLTMEETGKFFSYNGQDSGWV